MPHDDLSPDMALLDGLENATLTMSIGPVIRGYVGTAKRLEDRLIEGEPSEGGMLARETTWLLPVTGVAVDPKPGDTVTAAGPEVWIIQDVVAPRLSNMWKLRCRLPHITADVTAPSLQDQVTHYPSVDVTDAWGAKRSTHTTPNAAFTSVEAKIALRPSPVEQWAGQRQFVEVYDIYVAQQLPALNHGDVIQDQDGNTYVITGWRDRDQIDDLAVIEAEIRPRT